VLPDAVCWRDRAERAPGRDESSAMRGSSSISCVLSSPEVSVATLLEGTYYILKNYTC
jgi:hypothetical protein